MISSRPSYQHALELLHRAGLRSTRQRLALARLLFDGRHRHVTAEQLHAEALTNQHPVSLATVYNTLHQFTGVGLLREVVIDPGRSYFDTNVSDHHHFFHERNGELNDIPLIPLASVPAPPPGARIARIDVIIRLEDAEHPEPESSLGIGPVGRSQS